MDWQLNFSNPTHIVRQPTFTAIETLKESVFNNPSVTQYRSGYNITLLTLTRPFNIEGYTDEWLVIDAQGQSTSCIHGMPGDDQLGSAEEPPGVTDPRQTLFSAAELRKLRTLATGLHAEITALWEGDSLKIEVGNYQPPGWPDCTFDPQVFLIQAQILVKISP